MDEDAGGGYYYEGEAGVEGEEVLSCPKCGSTSSIQVDFDVAGGAAVCSECGYVDDTGVFETLGRVIGGGKEAGRVELYQGRAAAGLGAGAAAGVVDRGRGGRKTVTRVLDREASRTEYRATRLVEFFL
jgi:hypothetical protein